MERGLVLSLGNVESRGAKWLLHSPPPPRPPPASGLAQEWTVFLCFNVSDFSVKWRQDFLMNYMAGGDVPSFQT